MPLSSSAVVLAASLFCFAPQASAELTFAEKAEAAKLADEGMFFFNRGEFTQAVEKFEQAEAIVAAPTIVLAHGRALEKLGRWVLALSKF